MGRKLQCESALGSTKNQDPSSSRNVMYIEQDSEIDILDAERADCFVVEIYRRFGRSHRLHLQGKICRPLQRTQVNVKTYTSPQKRQWRPRSEQMYSCTLSLTQALDWGWLKPRPGLRGKQTRQPLQRRLGEPQGPCKIKLSLLGVCGLRGGGDNKYNWTLDGVVYFTHRQITH